MASVVVALIDLHCHILPGIDDGALDLADSLAMGRVAAGDGIETIAATPHIRHDHDVRIAELPGRVAEVNSELGRNEVPVTVVTGGEVAETALEGLDEGELGAVTLGGGGWIRSSLALGRSATRSWPPSAACGSVASARSSPTRSATSHPT